MPSNAQKKASKKYLESFETLRFRVPLGDGDSIKEFARNMRGMSLNSYVISLIEKDMKTSLKVEQTGN